MEMSYNYDLDPMRQDILLLEAVSYVEYLYIRDRTKRFNGKCETHGITIELDVEFVTVRTTPIYEGSDRRNVTILRRWDPMQYLVRPHSAGLRLKDINEIFCDL